MEFLIDQDLLNTVRAGLLEHVELIHGKEGEREWYECWREAGGHEVGIVIQRFRQEPWFMYFVVDDRISVLQYLTNQPGLHLITSIHSIPEAIKILNNLGFYAEVVNE